MEKIRELIDKLNYYTKLYDEGHPAISDKEWDDLYFELVKLEGQYDIYCEDSPTQKVNYQVVNELKKVTHNHPMLSLDKTKDMSDVYKFLNNQDFLSMCKMDGCFVADTKITMSDGTKKKIKDIQIGDYVLSFDETTNQLCNKRVINTFNNGKKSAEKWVRVKLFNKSNFNNHFYVKATKSHRFFTPKGWQEIGSLKAGEKVYCYDYNISNEQSNFLLGILLGDGWILNKNKQIKSYEIHWSKTKKTPYKEYAYKICQNMFNGHYSINSHTSGYKSDILDCNFKTFYDLPEYIKNKTNWLKVGLTFTKEICDNLTPLTLAVYYIDDGSLIKSQLEGINVTNKNPRCIFHTNRHSKEAVKLFSNYLISKGYFNNIQHEKDIQTQGSGDIIVLTDKGTEKFFDDIAKYIPKNLRPIKLGNKDKWQKAEENLWFCKKGDLGLIEGEIIEIKDNLDENKKIKAKYAYDIEVEDTHTYFANNFAVHNCTCSLRYLNGKLVSAETRGDGITGEDIYHNALVVKTIPKKINYKDELIVDGEIICTYQDFEPFSSEYVHPRNFAAGSIRLLDSAECAKRNLTFVAWDVIYGFEEEKYLWDKLNKIADLGFTIVPCVPTDDWDAKEFIQNQAKEAGYPIDGLVFKFNDIAYGKAQGATEHHLKNAIAFKFYDNSISSRLQNIEWSMGRTGVLTPVAVFDTVEIDFTLVNRASLHNVSVMRDILGYPYKNQPIEVAKMNMIIPQIVSADKGAVNNDKTIQIPTVCPICGEPLEIEKNNDVEQLVCTNPNCSGKLLNRLDHFCGKDGLDIKQLSIASLNDLMEWGYVNNFVDIFKLNEHETEWIQKSGWNRRSVERILDFIEEAKNTTSEKFISAIGIPLIGKGVAKQIVNNCGNYFAFREKVNNKYSFSNIYGFGPEKEFAILNFDYSEADEVAKYLNFVDKTQSTNNSLENVSVVITGSLTNYKNRNDLVADIEAHGGKVVGSVSKKTNYLINNDITSTSGKNKTAKELNVPIITEQEFIDKFLK